jgi:shikimate dehydrogenase
VTVQYAEVIGDPIAHSKSPVIHKFWLEKLGIEGDYRRTRVASAELANYLADRRSDPYWRGCNVTTPLKEIAVPWLDRSDEFAARAKAVNVIVPRDGLLWGYNTDSLGFREALEAVSASAAPARQHTVLYQVIGAGGAARAIAAALLGEEVTIYNRTRAKADALADELGLGARYGFSGGLEDLTPPQSFSDSQVCEQTVGGSDDRWYRLVLINASSLGMAGNPPLTVDLGAYPRDTLVIDIVYDPLETPLLRDARRLGMTTVDGLAMLIGQAANAFASFFDVPPPRQYDSELRKLLTR